MFVSTNTRNGGSSIMSNYNNVVRTAAEDGHSAQAGRDGGRAGASGEAIPDEGFDSIGFVERHAQPSEIAWVEMRS